MRRIYKPKLEDVAEILISEEEKKEWESFCQSAQDYRQKVKTENRKAIDHKPPYEKCQNALLKIYHNKCAFCENEFSSYKNIPESLTIEHFRPKNKNLYYWLAIEWTNLFPTCKGCNGPKGEKFPLFDPNTQIKSPFDTEDNLLIEKFDAEHLNEIEKPLLLHPEIDEPKDYFYFDKHANLQAKNADKRAEKTIENLGLNIQENMVLKRRKVLEDIRKEIEIQTLMLHNRGKANEPDFCDIAYNLSFKKIIERCFEVKKQSFNLLGYYMIWDFENLISKPIAEIIAEKVVEKAKMSTLKEIETTLNAAFRRYFESIIT